MIESKNELITEFNKLTLKINDESVIVRGFIDTIKTFSKNMIFVILRDRLEKVQCVVLRKQVNDFDSINKIPLESFVKVTGKAVEVKTEIKSCTIKNREIRVETLEVVSSISAQLPFSIKDASSKGTDRANVSYNVRLDNRFLDFRVPTTYAFVKLLDGVMSGFRTYLKSEDFTEIRTTKIIQSGSEGGANLFSIDYFGKKAFLAQSSQLYKQSCIAGGMKRVFEIGYAYRAEVQNVNRYLSEFTQVDIEMEIENDYMDVIRFVHKVILHVIKYLKEHYSRELEIVREYTDFKDVELSTEPVIIDHSEGVDILKAQGYEIDYEDDFNREQEKALGAHIKKLHNVDLFVIKDYPKSQRAFYTQVCKGTNKTRSYDFLLRGEEILSGAQRETDFESLKNAIAEKGVNVDGLDFYLKMFKFAVPPHGGVGIGLERFCKCLFETNDIRPFSLFPRDPSRLYP
ncbi:SYDC [Hepatospora eriocheir]|uniref:Probable aspartate--tRNA ligase, cytoplasmic n=1 Tax=Hepatospora eriocheir TaxID=1081669 RepID=A0A1X0QE81_9MICR|nr:SYDC [Hepatospora eriocheir]